MYKIAFAIMLQIKLLFLDMEVTFTWIDRCLLMCTVCGFAFLSQELDQLYLISELNKRKISFNRNHFKQSALLMSVLKCHLHFKST